MLIHLIIIFFINDFYFNLEFFLNHGIKKNYTFRYIKQNKINVHILFLNKLEIF
jgi:hypothetical protein